MVGKKKVQKENTERDPGDPTSRKFFRGRRAVVDEGC